jgi:hypothetical protein
MKLGHLLTILAMLVSLPVVAASDKLKEFHALCTSPYAQPISVEVACLHALVNNSTDPIYNRSDAGTELFLMKADKLASLADKNQITQDAARAKFLKMLLDLQDSHKAEVLAIQTHEDVAQQRADAAQARETREQEQSAHELEEKRQLALSVEAQTKAAAALEAQTQQQADLAASNLRFQQQQMREAAIAHCVDMAMARSEYAFNSRANCQANPNYWQSVPITSRTSVTNCQALGGGSISCNTTH